MPELPEVEVMRRDLEKEVVGKKIKTVEVAGLRSIRRHKQKKDFIGALEGHKIVSVARRGQVPRAAARRSGGAGRAPRDVGPAAQGEVGARQGAEAHARRDHVHAGRLDAVRRSAHVRRDVRHVVRRPRAGRGARAPRTRSARDRAVVGAVRPHARRSQDAVEGVADGPEVHRRDRQHLQRRDPLPGRAPLGPHERLVVAARGAALVPRDRRDAAGRGEVPRFVALRRAVPRPVRTARRLPAPPPGVRPRGPRLRPVPARPSCAPASRTARRSSARPARCERRRARARPGRRDGARARACGSGTRAASRRGRCTSSASPGIGPTARSRPSSRGRPPPSPGWSPGAGKDPPRGTSSRSRPRSSPRPASAASRSADRAAPRVRRGGRRVP